MKPKGYVSILLSAMFIGATAHAETVTLNQVVNAVVESSPKVQKAKSQLSETSWRKREAYNGFLPSVSASVTYLMDKKYLYTDVSLLGNPVSIAQVVPTSLGTLSANWSLFDGFASTNRLQGANRLEEAAENEYDWTVFQTQREVALLYFKVIAAEQLKTVAEQNQKALEEIVKNVQAQRKVGVITDFDVLRAEVQLSEAKTEVMNAIDNLEIAKGKLSEAMGREQSDLDITGSLPVLKADAVQNLNADDVKGRKDLIALSLKTEASQYGEKAAEKYWVPKISLVGQYNYYNNRNSEFSDWDNYRNAYTVGLTMSWNLFDGMTSIAKSKQSVEQRFQAEKSLEQMKLKSSRDLDMWKRKYLYFCQVYAARTNDIAKAQESSRLAHEGQKVGARTGTEVLIAEAELYRSKAQAVNAQVGAVEALFNIEMSTGKTLFQF